MLNKAGIPDNNGMVGNIEVYKRVCGNQNIVAYFYVSANKGVRTNCYPITNCWCAMVSSTYNRTYGSAFKDGYVISNGGVWIYGDIESVYQRKSATDIFVIDFNPVFVPDTTGYKFVEGINYFDFRFFPSPVCKP